MKIRYIVRKYGWTQLPMAPRSSLHMSFTEGILINNNNNNNNNYYYYYYSNNY